MPTGNGKADVPGVVDVNGNIDQYVGYGSTVFAARKGREEEEKKNAVSAGFFHIFTNIAYSHEPAKSCFIVGLSGFFSASA